MPDDPKQTLAEIRDLLTEINDRLKSGPPDQASAEVLRELQQLREAQTITAKAAHKTAHKDDFSLGRVFALLVLIFIIVVCLAGFVI